MKLIMTGGGDSEHFNAIDNHFINLLGAKPKLLYIPLAGDEADYAYGLDRIKRVFSTIVFSDIKMCIDLSILDWAYLSVFDAIYFDGGNTFKLMSHIRDTHTYELLHRFLHSGGVINGDSAGAIVLGSHLETAHIGDGGDDNDSEVISYQGLNFLGPIALHCHYESTHDIEIKEFSQSYGYPVLALHEDTAISIEEGIVKVIGNNQASFFMQDKKIDILPSKEFVLIDINFL